MIRDRLALKTEVVSGSTTSERRWLRDVGEVLGLKLSWERNRGPSGCEFTLTVPPRWGRSRPSVIDRGRHVSVADGSNLLWGGRIEEVTPIGGGFTVRASGWAVAAEDYLNINTSIAAISATTPNVKLTGLPGTVDAAVDAAIVSGWPVVRATSFSGPVSVPQPIQAQLDAVTLITGGTWSVQPDRTVRQAPATTDPQAFLTSLVEPASTTSQDYLTDLLGIFTDSTLTTTDQTNVRLARTIANSLPRVQRTIDLRPLGPITPTAAVSYLNTALGRTVPLPPIITGALTVTYGQANSRGNSPIPPSRLGSLVGQVARIKGSQPAPAGDLTLYSTTDIVIQRVEWDADSDTASVLPVTGEPRDLAGLLTVESTDLAVA